MQKYSHCKTKQDRMKDQINYLNRALEDLRKSDTSFQDEANDSLLSNIQTQISLCNADAIKLMDQITNAELDNVLHTVNLKLSTIGIPLESDLNQEAVNDILFSYIKKMRNLNISYEKQYCQTNELECYLKLLNDENYEYEQFKSETNEMIQKLEELTTERKRESEMQSQIFEKLKADEKNLINDFQSRMDLLKESSDYIIEKSSETNENYDTDLINSIEELFLKLQNPNAKECDIKLTLKSIIHLSNLRSSPAFSNNNNNNSNNGNELTSFITENRNNGFHFNTPKNQNIANFTANSIELNSNFGFDSFKNTGFASFQSANNNTNTGFNTFSNKSFNNFPFQPNRNLNISTSNNSNINNNTFTAFKNEIIAQNLSKLPENKSCHEIIASLQQKISINNPK